MNDPSPLLVRARVWMQRTAVHQDQYTTNAPVREETHTREGQRDLKDFGSQCMAPCSPLHCGGLRLPEHAETRISGSTTGDGPGGQSRSIGCCCRCLLLLLPPPHTAWRRGARVMLPATAERHDAGCSGTASRKGGRRAAQTRRHAQRTRARHAMHVTNASDGHVK